MIEKLDGSSSKIGEKALTLKEKFLTLKENITTSPRKLIYKSPTAEIMMLKKHSRKINLSEEIIPTSIDNKHVPTYLNCDSIIENSNDNI